MKIYIGFDVSKPECFDVCKFSIQKRTNEISINKIGNSILSIIYEFFNPNFSYK